MPEGDTVYRTADLLQAALSGGVIERFDIRVPRFANATVPTGTVASSRARGKHLLLDIDTPAGSLVLHSHLKMEGKWQVIETGQRWKWPAHTVRAVVGVRHRDGRRIEAVGTELGAVDMWSPAEESRELAFLGPDVYGPDWDTEVVLTRLREQPNRAIGDAILDQRVLAGVGNVYRLELCFLQGVNPATSVGDFDARSPLALRRIVERTYLVMGANRHRRHRVTTGVDKPGQRLWVYGRGGKPCLRCGTPIMRAEGSGLERISYWCPQCQQ